MARPRIAWFSPFNCGAADSSSVSAYVSDELCPFLEQGFDIQYFSNCTGEYRGRPVEHYLTATERHALAPYDVFFYQVEDGPGTHFSRAHLGLMPGIVLFHDYLLTDPGPDPLLNSPWRVFLNRFLGRSVHWPERGGEFHISSPYALREGAFSLVSLFSSERSLGEWKRNSEQGIRERYPQFSKLHSFYLPLPVDTDAVNLRSSETTVRTVAYCGSPQIECRAHKILEALRQFGRGVKLLWLTEERERAACEDLLQEFEVQNVEIVVGRSPIAWSKLLSSADIALHTLFSVYGQPGPYLPISLASGLPCVVTNFGAAEFLPEAVVYKIEPGDTEVLQLTELLRGLLKGEISTQPKLARNFAIEMHERRQVAQELSLVIERSLPYLSRFYSDWSKFRSEARAALLAEAVRYSEEDAAPFDLSVPLQAEKFLIANVFNEVGWGSK